MPAIDTIPIEEAGDFLITENDGIDEEVRKYHLSVGRAIWPHGITLVCRHCGRDREVSISAIPSILNNWPVCCGETMRIDDPKIEQAAA